MNIVVLNGSPRPHGNTAAMITAYCEGAEAAGHRVTVFDVCRMHIAGCLACEYCHNKAAGDENKSPELLERLRAAGAALTDLDERNVARLVIRAGDVVVRAPLNQTQAARDLMNRLPLTVSGADSGVDYCCELKEGVFDEAEKQQGWTDGDVSVADGWFALLHSGQEQSQGYRVMVVAHLDEESNAQIQTLPPQVTFELSLEEPYVGGTEGADDGASA